MKWVLSILALIYSLQIATAFATIKIGHPPFRPPFVISQVEGFDIDLMHILCNRMKEVCEFYPMNIDKLYTALDEGKIDVAIGAISDSEARRVNYIFSLPYLTSDGQFLVLKSKGYKSINDLHGKKIGTVRASIYEDFLANHYASEFQMVLFNGPITTIAALNEGKIDGIFLERVSMNYWEQQSNGLLIELGKPITVDNGFAIMTVPKHANLIRAINVVLLKMETDGTYIKLYNRYFNY